MLVLDDTITALATSSGGSINIIRISGDEAINIIGKIFNKKLEDHKITYGKIIYNEKLIDEVLISFFKGPKSYTGEDTVEINCHGGIITAKKILDILLRIGCRLATNGEFTKRAFLNGRLDLTNAEAVMSIIDAKTEKEQEIALSQLEGELSSEISDYRTALLHLIASIEASIDYPEHDLEHDNLIEIEEKVLDIQENIESLVSTYEKGKIIKEGIETAIIGSPNVGKSSFLNRLVGEEVAIFKDVAVTTIDTLKDYVKINGIFLKIIDTEGIIETNYKVEKIGV
ncbi:MAG: tRNA uridine-5-carboxymethylaminomethyl(34) synthesis GTPase MnmE, partial [Lachnospirales bacterium]